MPDAERGVELTIKGEKFHPDGYYGSTKTVYEFDGCVWHGCSLCQNVDTVNEGNGLSMETMRLKMTRATVSPWRL